MADELVIFEQKPAANYLIAGWRRQWSNGGRISSGLPRYLIEKLSAKKIGELGPQVSTMCYPFQVAGTHDAFRPVAAFQEGLPSESMHRENYFFDGGNGLIIFLGEEPWYRLDLYVQGFIEAIKELGIKQTVAVEGVNGPAPPDLERRITCAYSKATMKEDLERFGLQFSSYGSDGRRGPTIGMALVSMAHFEYPDIEMFRLGAMAPLYPLLSSNNQQLGITRDHRSFYDIMRRLNAMFDLTIDLNELKSLADVESRELQTNLEKLSDSSREARQVIEQVRAEYSYTPFEQRVELDPALDQTLEDILRNLPGSSDRD
ncbi:MAG: PAC2 family protein [Chloroflexi bacterium]|nr:PAC2 family protein [Chloroflexota bacterium]